MKNYRITKNQFQYGVIAAGVLLFLYFIYYCAVGTNGNIEEITARAPTEIPERGWEIMRYEGYQYGSFGKHGGRAWYHSIQYRVQVSLWDGELEYWYGSPEKVSRVNVEHKSN
jgi:hypothetical protein